MAKSKQIPCVDCGLPFDVEFFDSINVKETPSLKSKVKDGSLFLAECPHCGRVNLIGQAFLYNDPDQKVMIWLLPEDPASRHLEESIRSAIGRGDKDLLDGYVTRIVRSAGDLMEKVIIFDCGLDDMAMEICKHVTKMELSENLEKDKVQSILEAPFKFYRTNGPDNELEFSYPLEGRMHGVTIGFNVYEDCAAILSRNPDMKPKEFFPVIDSQWVSERIG